MDLGKSACLRGCEPCAECCACEEPERATPPAQRWRRWAWRLTAFTIAWNSLEALVAVISGLLARSIALVGFGLDSLVEMASAVVIAWRLAVEGTDWAANERAERRAVRLIALSFFAIVAYVTYDSVARLVGVGEQPEPSLVGLGLTALSLVVMPLLVWAKRRVALELGSVALRADAAETLLCAYLSAVVLVGLAANALWGWWWMDPVAGFGVAGFALFEGQEAWRTGSALEGETTGPLAQVLCLVNCCPACPTTGLELR